MCRCLLRLYQKELGLLDLMRDEDLHCLCPEAHSLEEFKATLPLHLREENGAYLRLMQEWKPDLFSAERIKVAKKAFKRIAQAAKTPFDAEAQQLSAKIAREQQAAGISSRGRKRKLSEKAASSDSFVPRQLFAGEQQ